MCRVACRNGYLIASQARERPSSGLLLMQNAGCCSPESVIREFCGMCYNTLVTERILIEDAGTWDDALRALPHAHALQSWIWGELKVNQGWRVRRYLWRDADEPVASAQVLILQRGKLRIGYVPRGPVLDWSNASRVTAVLQSLENLAREKSLMFLKIDPDVVSTSPVGGTLGEKLQQRGWHYAFEQIQFRNTLEIDLQDDLDTLLVRMKPKGRYNIRRAVQKGVTVRAATLEDIPLLVDIYAETAQRELFAIRELGYYRDSWRVLLQSGIGHGFIAQVDGEPVAMMILLHFGTRAWSMYTGSYDRHRASMPNYLLLWECLRYAKSCGCSSYDMWGAPDVFDETDPLWGAYRFKSSFGPALVRYIGAFDFPSRRWLYTALAATGPGRAMFLSLIHRV